MSKIKDKVIDDLNKKVESEADEFKKKYPEIAKMTVAEVVATNLFTVGSQRVWLLSSWCRYLRIEEGWHEHRYPQAE
jgi:hypothetical protein